MKAIRFILRIILLPVMAVLVVIRLFVEFLAGISAVIFRVIAGIFSSDRPAKLWLWSGKFRGMPENRIGWLSVLSPAMYG